MPQDQHVATLMPAYVMADAQRDTELKPLFIGYEEEGSYWLHSVHRSPIPNSDLFDQQSPYGYGGPICNSTSQSFISKAWSAYVDFCKSERVLAEFVRLHPLVDYSQSYLGTTSYNRDTVLVALDIADIGANYTTRCRTAIRKAVKNGIVSRVIEKSRISSRFMDFYFAGMQAIGASDFYFFNRDYFDAFSHWDNVELIACTLNDDWLSAGLFLIDGDTMEYHLSATTLHGRSLGATNLLLDFAAKVAKEKGCKYLYLGGGTDSDKNNSLLFFKKGFSTLSKPFLTGFTTFMPLLYEELRAEYLARGIYNGRSLFYRV